MRWLFNLQQQMCTRRQTRVQKRRRHTSKTACVCLHCTLTALLRMQVVPDALVLHFAAADVHEAAGDMAKAKEVYEALAAPLDGEKEAAPATPDVRDAKDAKPPAATQVEVGHPWTCRGDEEARGSLDMFVGLMKHVAPMGPALHVSLPEDADAFSIIFEECTCSV